MNLNLHWLKPPYSKYHILILSSLTVFLGIGLLLTYDQHDRNRIPGKRHTELAGVSLVDGEELRQEYTTAIEQLDEGNDDGALMVNNFQIIDIRPTKIYEQGHIAGSYNVGLEDLKNAHLREGITVVIYGDDDVQTEKAIKIVREKNISKVEALNSSLESLKDAGYTIVKD